MRMLPFHRVTVLFALAALSGCSTLSSWMPGAKPVETPAISNAPGVQTLKEHRFLGILSPYRVDIQQGNFVSREMVSQVKENMKSREGMTPEQVRFVMGTPLITDIFHENRWDYVFRLEKSNGDVIFSNITLYFEKNRLKRLDGGELPTEKEYLALIAGIIPAPPPEVIDPVTKKPGIK